MLERPGFYKPDFTAQLCCILDGGIAGRAYVVAEEAKVVTGRPGRQVAGVKNING